MTWKIWSGMIWKIKLGMTGEIETGMMALDSNADLSPRT